jgi:PAS domain S-box-containing protein
MGATDPCPFIVPCYNALLGIKKMTAKPSYNELLKKVEYLEIELAGQKSVEKLLWDKQDQLFKVLDSLDAFVYVADLHTYEILFVNRLAEKLFGQITGKICWQVLQTGMTGPCPFCPNEKLITAEGKPGEVIATEMQNTLNGRWYSIRDRAIEWFDGRIVHLQIALDISDRKEVETALQTSEEKYRTVADFTYDWEYWINEKGEFNYISPSFTRITGYEVEEFLEDPPAVLAKIVHPDSRTSFEAHLIDELDSEKVYHLEFGIICKTGDERWISHYCQPVYSRDGKFLGRRASNRDITERQKAQRVIKLNELRQATLLQLYDLQDLPENNICNFVLESSLPITASNIGFLGFLNEDESLMRITAWSNTVMEQCQIHKKPLVLDVQKSGLWGEAVRQRHPVIINNYQASPMKKGIPDGHVEIERFMAVPLFDDGQIVALAAVGNKRQDYDENDVRQLQLLIEGMWQVIKRRQAEDKLIKQSEMIKQFTNSVSHDLKNPAVAIHGLIQVIKRKYSELSEEKMEKFLDQIIKSAEQIISLSEDINIYISTREAPVHFKEIDLKNVWQTIREEFLPRLRKRHIQWTESNIQIPPIKADQNSLLRVFRNLVDNALKYGGSSLSEIALGYEASATHHILTVKNDGEIISPDDTEAIFEIFKRKAGPGVPAGTGLGLATVKEIARHHGGESWVTSSSRDKTTFYVSIAQNL